MRSASRVARAVVERSRGTEPNSSSDDSSCAALPPPWERTLRPDARWSAVSSVCVSLLGESAPWACVGVPLVFLGRPRPRLEAEFGWAEELVMPLTREPVSERAEGVKGETCSAGKEVCRSGCSLGRFGGLELCGAKGRLGRFFGFGRDAL